MAVRGCALCVVLAFGGALQALPVAAQQVDCTDRASLPQVDLNQCASLDAQMAEEAMMASFANAATRVPEQNLQRFYAGQNAFLAYRHLVCSFESDQAGGGSIGPLLHALCLTRLTVQRTADLDLVGQP